MDSVDVQEVYGLVLEHVYRIIEQRTYDGRELLEIAVVIFNYRIVYVIGRHIWMEIRESDVCRVASGGKAEGFYRLAERHVRDPLVRAELDCSAGLQGLDQPEGEGDVLRPGALTDVPRDPVQLVTDIELVGYLPEVADMRQGLELVYVLDGAQADLTSAINEDA
jgi:hypothetical protein